MNRRTVATPVLDIGYLEAGDPDGPVAVLMRGFLYDAHACAEAGGLLAAEGWHVLARWLRGFGPTIFRSFATRPFTRLLWEQWSPDWHFSDVTFERSTAAFVNPDFVPVVIHSYRHRYGLASGDPAYAEFEERLSTRPVLDVPTVLMVSEGGLQRDFTSDTSQFPRLVDRVHVDGGHNLIQENPAEMAAAFRLLRDSGSATSRPEGRVTA